MADFRRVVTALAVVVLLSGLAVSANAQVAPAFSCSASAAVPPLLRAEGLTELMGDIVLNCTGGTQGASLGTANFTVFVGTQVTSRLNSDGLSEAVLLVNDNTASAVRGVVAGNAVTFIGVPVVAPGTAGSAIFRISNVRVNASTIGAGPFGTPGQVQAFVSISGSTSVPITNPAVFTGFVQSGLDFDLRTPADKASSGVTLRQCDTTVNTTPQATVRFSEKFATAFKAQGGTDQIVPGQIYNTESGLVLTVGDKQVGLADSGTRLRATFANIPAGTSVFVSLAPLNKVSGLNAALLKTETSTGGSRFAAASDLADFGAVTINASGTGTAVWEVTDASPLLTQNFDFAVRFATTPNVGANTPAAGVQGTVAGSFAPAPPTINATDAAKASATLLIPRFIDSNLVKNLIMFNRCVTNLLFPYVVNIEGFDTGIAIANTSKDPFGTTPQAGTCQLNFFGSNAPAAAITTDSIGASTTLGPVFASSAMNLAPGFSGYVIAVCQFQFAHGFAFVSDIGAHNVAMGYLALVMGDAPTTARTPQLPESFNN